MRIKILTRKKLKWWEKLDVVKTKGRLPQLNKHAGRNRLKSEFIKLIERLESKQMEAAR